MPRVEVYLRSDVYKPWFVLSALAYDNVTAPVRDRTRTDSNGEYSSRVFSGLRLDDVSVGFRQRGYVVHPSLYSVHGGTLTSNLEHHLSAGSAREVIFADVYAWPAEDSIEKGDRRPFVALDGREIRLSLGRQKRQLALQLVSAASAGPVTIIARYENGVIRTAEGLPPGSLAAPLDGYKPEARAVPDCDRSNAMVFFIRDHANQYGWVSIDPQSICLQQKRMRVDFRLSNQPGIRSLVGESEVSW